MKIECTRVYFDAHIHLQDGRFAGKGPERWLEAKALGLVGALCCATAPDDWSAVAAIAAEYPEILPAYGVHPWYVHRLSKGWQKELDARLKTGRCALGEVGLDARLAVAPLALQTELLEKQLRLALEYDLPVSIHCLDAWDELLRFSGLLRELSFAIHAFASPAHIERLAALGAFFSFNAALGRRGHKKMKTALSACPPKRILLETDAPDFPLFTPNNADPDQPNLPSALPRIASMAAAILGMDETALAELVIENSRSYLRMEI